MVIQIAVVVGYTVPVQEFALVEGRIDRCTWQDSSHTGAEVRQSRRNAVCSPVRRLLVFIRGPIEVGQIKRQLPHLQGCTLPGSLPSPGHTPCEPLQMTRSSPADQLHGNVQRINTLIPLIRNRRTSLLAIAVN